MLSIHSTAVFRCRFNTLEVRNPIRFPGLSAIGRVGLFPVRGGTSDVRPDVAHADGLSLESIVRIEIGAAIGKATLHGRVQGAEGITTVQPPDRPLSGARIIGAQRYSAIGAPGYIEPVVARIGPAAHQQSSAQSAVEFHPLVTRRKALLEPSMV